MFLEEEFSVKFLLKKNHLRRNKQNSAEIEVIHIVWNTKKKLKKDPSQNLIGILKTGGSKDS